MKTCQIAKIQSITTRLTRQSTEGLLSFFLMPVDRGYVVLSATNVHGDLAWYQATEDFYAVIGPRGGVRKYAGSINL